MSDEIRKGWDLPEASLDLAEVAAAHSQELVDAALNAGSSQAEALLFSIAGSLSTAVMQAKKVKMTFAQFKDIAEVTWTREN